MKILFVDQNSSLGGGQRVLLDLMLYARDRGHLPFLMVPDEGYVTGVARANEIPSRTFPFPGMTPGKKPFYEKAAYPYRSLRASNAIADAALQTGADIIFANGPRIFLPCVMAGKNAGVPVHLQLHLLFEKGAEQKLISILLKSDAVRSAVACSSKVNEPFKNIRPRKMTTVPYWVSPPFLKEPSRRETIRKRFGLNEDDIAIGVIGRISPTKGQKLFLEALVPLMSRFQNLHLLIAGTSDFESGGEEELLHSMAKRSPEKNRIHFPGMTEGLDFYDGLDILVVPSMWEEPFGLVSVEGMARELPLVVTRSGALSEIVMDGETGFVVEKNAVQLMTSVEKLMASKELRDAMGRNGKERVVRHFNPEIQIKKIMDIALNEC
jgi:glycosyltransferase involved in cell wall biosynthesis